MIKNLRNRVLLGFASTFSLMLAHQGYSQTWNVPANGTSPVLTGIGTSATAGTDDFSILSGGNTVMRILENGNVGVGTASPTSKFSVAGSIGWNFSSGRDNNVLSIDQGGAIELGASNGYANAWAGGSPFVDFHYGNGLAQDHNVRIMNSGESTLSFWTQSGGANVMVLKGSNLGIGTVSPGYKLHISGSVNPGLGIANTSSSGGEGSLAFATANGAYSSPSLAGDFVIRGNLVDNSKIIITNNDLPASRGFVESIVFATGLQGIDEKIRMRIYANGAVSIGDINNNNEFPAGTTFNTTGAYKLYVAQGILTPKLKIGVPNTANWSDFVFAKDYKLRPLSEVESFIEKNKHLPEVPSASNVVANGIDVAKMDALLLQKIEELTLYLIEMKKENEKISKEMEALKAKK